MSAKVSLGPIRIQITKQGQRAYKSIDQIDWDDVPGFAVLTGLNGSGKTQLLEVLGYRLTDTVSPTNPELSQMNVAISGDTFSADGVVFISSAGQAVSSQILNIQTMQTAKLTLYDTLFQQNTSQDMRAQRLKARIMTMFREKKATAFDYENFLKILPEDFSFMLDEGDFSQGLTHVFLAHRIRVLEKIESGHTLAEAEKILGPSPWSVLNEVFTAADFPYRVVPPAESGLLQPTQISLENTATKLRIKPEDSSSGEKVLLSLVYWLYSSQRHNQFPKLLLLDEPDAHLHPSMTRHLLNVLREVLVERYGVRVILTTHSPSTVALAPEGSVFEMFKDPPRIRPSASRSTSIGLLTAGLVTVSPSTRFAIVEDAADVSFYNGVRDLLTDYGPSRDPQAIKPAPSIVFLPASTGSGAGKVGGGKTVVEAWVDKFDQAPLDEVVRGVIDRDQGNLGTARIYPIGRYSIENYQLDPFVVFGVLLDAGTAPAIPNVTITSGDEHRLRSMPAADLQAILDVVCSMVEPILRATGKPADVTPRAITFSTGVSVNYPAWVIDFRGHDLLPVFQQVFGGPGTINPPRLEKSSRRVRLIPVELVGVMNRLQA